MTAPTVTVTGWDGFVGRHLVRELHARGVRVIGIALDPLLVEDGPDEVVCTDLTADVPAEAMGDVVIHLAGLAAVRPSYDDPQRYLCGNTAMVTRLGEAILESRRPVRLLLASTGLVYGGDPESPRGFAETAALRPRSPYAVSKIAVEFQGEYYRSLGVETIATRSFNTLGPGQGGGYLLPDLVAAMLGHPEDATLLTGRLDTVRDYTDVREVVRAYAMLALSPAHRFRVYNVASGRAVSGMQMLAEVCRVLGRRVPSTRLDPARTRTAGVAVAVGDATRLRDEFGWEPSIPLARSVQDFIESRELS